MLIVSLPANLHLIRRNVCSILANFLCPRISLTHSIHCTFLCVLPWRSRDWISQMGQNDVSDIDDRVGTDKAYSCWLLQRLTSFSPWIDGKALFSDIWFSAKHKNIQWILSTWANSSIEINKHYIASFFFFWKCNNG